MSDKEKSVSFFRKKAEKHTADKKKNVTLETFDGDILLSERLDRRILPDVPDPSGQRPLTGAVLWTIQTMWMR